MTSKLHFPTLSRQPEESYHNTLGEFYAASNYKNNYEKIAEDCKHRCVYCDATEKECGGERFSLDHFRPRNVFENKFGGILVKHPYNLHLSCQKCNALKSKDWRGCEDDIQGPTHCDGKGYIDRFEQDLSIFLDVDKDGRIHAKQPYPNYKSPGNYIIKRLHLNRPNRVYLRKKRYMNLLVRNIETLLSKRFAEILEQCKDGHMSSDEGMTNISKAHELQRRFLDIKA